MTQSTSDGKHALSLIGADVISVPSFPGKTPMSKLVAPSVAVTMTTTDEATPAAAVPQTRFTSPGSVGVGERDGNDTMNACMTTEIKNKSRSGPVLVAVFEADGLARRPKIRMGSIHHAVIWLTPTQTSAKAAMTIMATDRARHTSANRPACVSTTAEVSVAAM